MAKFGEENMPTTLLRELGALKFDKKTIKLSILINASQHY